MWRLSFLLPFLTPCFAKTITLDWDISWVSASPDGYTRPVIGVNGQWPCPGIEADVGDTIVVNVKNSLGNETTGIHWHGMYQQGTISMDGASEMTQCPIPPGSTFTYTFTAYPAGSYWWHAHNHGQYPDGLRGPMIIHDRRLENSYEASSEFTMTVSDWYHDQMPYLLHSYLGPDNPNGIEPIPNSCIVNDAASTIIPIRSREKLLLRIINIGALAHLFVQFDSHQLTVVAVDSIPVRPRTVDGIRISPGQRYDVLITGKPYATRNYGLITRMDTAIFKANSSSSKLNCNGILSYSAKLSNPPPLRTTEFSLADDITFQPTDNQPLLEPVDQTITYNPKLIYYPNIGPRIALGDAPYHHQKVPTLYTALTTGTSATNPAVYGKGVQPTVLRAGKVIQIVVNNADTAAHPMHLHGHHFQVVGRGSGTWNGVVDVNQWGGLSPGVRRGPMRRDTVDVPPNGWVVIRFKAERPGIWLFHCHIEFHVEAGMTTTFIEAPELLQTISHPKIPDDHIQVCKLQNRPTEGNCAGKKGQDVLDTRECEEGPKEAGWG
ncbi:multicopper oxidase [Patellaria atrata CBS 101060]|uniref:Multicopper oxidase n=1 Tax=Patellaria atrata CBS 101060 TaxID=1346257 RepID=A0A9P4SET6_9PEZI|nr:multicopper oxidase [Patellaria atrata CBS 101060]